MRAQWGLCGWPAARPKYRALAKKKDHAGRAREDQVGEGCVSAKKAAEQTGFLSSVFHRAMREGTIDYVECGRRRVMPKHALREFLADRLVLK